MRYETRRTEARVLCRTVAVRTVECVLLVPVAVLVLVAVCVLALVLDFLTTCDTRRWRTLRCVELFPDICAGSVLEAFVVTVALAAAPDASTATIASASPHAKTQDNFMQPLPFEYNFRASASNLALNALPSSGHSARPMLCEHGVSLISPYDPNLCNNRSLPLRLPPAYNRLNLKIIYGYVRPACCALARTPPGLCGSIYNPLFQFGMRIRSPHIPKVLKTVTAA